MELNRLNKLLNEISKIVAKNEAQQEEKRRRGENFNIFSVMGLQTKEVRLHSAFLAELLNPQGDHGLGDKFLVAFLEKVLNNNSSIDTESAEVFKECNIGQISEDGKSGGQIDILIRDKNNNSIIIENKINAEDQEYQLLRYHNYAYKNKLHNVLVYLTKEGKDAREYSTGGEKLDYTRISYQDDIIPWLEYCEQIAVRFPLVRETIHQYIINLKDILNIMNENYKEDLLPLMLEHDNALIITEILNCQSQWQKQLVDRYIWNPLKDYCKEYSFEDDNNGGWYIKKKTWKTSSIVIGTDNTRSWNDVYIGIKSEGVEAIKKLTCFEKEPIKGYPYGWSYLGNWEDSKDRKEIIDGIVFRHIKELINEILNEIEQESIVL